MHYISSEAKFLVILFSIVYISWLGYRTAKDKLDLFDLLMLCMVAMLPTFVVIFPETVRQALTALQIEFPFVLLFALLHLASFVQLLFVVTRLKEAEKRITRLTQEVGLQQAQRNEQLIPTPGLGDCGDHNR